MRVWWLCAVVVFVYGLNASDALPPAALGDVVANAASSLNSMKVWKLLQFLHFHHTKYEASRGADCKTDWLWVRSPFEEKKYLLKFIFKFLRSGVEVKRGVEFCHSTHNCLNTRFPLPILCGIQCEADLITLSNVFKRPVVEASLGEQACYGKRVRLWIRFPVLKWNV